MTDDFKKYVQNFEKSSKGSERKNTEIIKEQAFYGFF